MLNIRIGGLFIHERVGLFYVARKISESRYELCSKGFVSKLDAKDELDAQRHHEAMVKYR